MICKQTGKRKGTAEGRGQNPKPIRRAAPGEVIGVPEAARLSACQLPSAACLAAGAIATCQPCCLAAPLSASFAAPLWPANKYESQSFRRLTTVAFHACLNASPAHVLQLSNGRISQHMAASVTRAWVVCNYLHHKQLSALHPCQRHCVKHAWS